MNPEICELALLLHLLASSASIERIFSNFSFIQTKLKNRLGLDKTSKLVTCYRELRGSVEFDWWYILDNFLVLDYSIIVRNIPKHTDIYTL